MSALKKNKRSRIIISGILNEQYRDILKLFMDEGMEEFESIIIGEWTPGLLGMRANEVKYFFKCITSNFLTINS